MSEDLQIGFPAPLLGLDAVRIPILLNEGNLFALMKPAGVLVQADAWYPKVPVLVEAIRYQASQGKPELVKLGISTDGLWAITDLDPECAGPVLFSSDRKTAEKLRNLYGSRAFQFDFELISNINHQAIAMRCDLPLARHKDEKCMLVSHTTGKKSQTEFRREMELGRYSQWMATTSFARRHQIPVHAFESGLPILGDRLYARSGETYLSALKRDYRPKKNRDERPLFGSPAYYLKELRLPDGRPISCPPPTRWSSSVRQLIKYTLPE